MNTPLEGNIRRLLRWFLGLILVWAALGKLANLQEFYGALLAYRLPLPGGLLRGLAIVVPWLELLSGLLLLWGRRHPGALAWALVLFAVFALGTGQAWLRGLDISCGCLDLRLAGVAPGSAAAGWLESARFACVRALALAAVALHLLRRESAARSAP
jgi:uncharacterized membrane protein YphA (DoxX/SURF4 family)